MIVKQSVIEKFLYFILLLVVTLSVGLGLYYYQNAQHTHSILVAGCESGNEFRRENKTLWRYILDIPPEEPLTPEEQKTRDDFTKFLDETFAERDCSRI